MEENVIQINGGIAVNINSKCKKCIWKRLSLESCYMLL